MGKIGYDSKIQLGNNVPKNHSSKCIKVEDESFWQFADFGPWVVPQINPITNHLVGSPKGNALLGGYLGNHERCC